MRIKMIVMDVDGTLTDGRLYTGENGEIFKVFNVKDGLGIRKLETVGITPVIITGRRSGIVIERANELGVKEVYQSVKDKMQILSMLVSKYSISFSDVAYIGDDENDLECIEKCGMSGCPCDAVETVKTSVNFISSKKGGEGAVRDFIEMLLKIPE